MSSSFPSFPPLTVPPSLRPPPNHKTRLTKKRAKAKTHHLILVLSQSLEDLVQLLSPDLDECELVEELSEVLVDGFEEFL